MQRKLKVDGSSLWDNPENQFILRFNDLNPEKQNKLTQRLKETSQRQRVRELSGPTIENIFSLLKEINPILYAEGKERRGYGQWKRWNIKSVQTLSGWHYRELDKLIYRFLCLNRPPNYQEIRAALYLSLGNVSTNNIEQIRLILDQLPHENTEPSISVIPQEIGINEIQSARERTERRNNNY